MPSGDGQERLHGEIELRAKSSAHGCRNNTNRVLGDSQDCSNILAIGVRRLRARLNFDAVTDAPGEPRFRLDISVLDESGFKMILDDNIGARQSGIDVAVNDASTHQD